MPRSLRSLIQRLSRTSDTTAVPEAAPGALRRRVLATVRGDTTRPGRCGRKRPAAWIAGTIAFSALLLAVALTVLLDQSDRRGNMHPEGVNLSARAPRVSLRRIGYRGELAISGMREPPIGEVYEVWRERRGQAPQPTDALFTVTSDGSATVDIPGSLRGLHEVMVTAEPLGGSASPTSPALLRVALSG